MTFQPILPIGGYAGWKFLSRTLAQQKQAFVASAELQRDESYFREKIGAVDNAEALVSDRRLLKVALGAFGLDADINSKFFVRKVLEDGTLDTTDLANRLSDKRYLEFSKAFGFGDYTTPSTKLSDFADKIVAAYSDHQFEIALGDQDPDMRLALSLKRDLAHLAAKDSSEIAKWYSVMGATPLRTVFETALGLPSTFAAIDIDRQLSMFQDKTEQMFGNNSVSQFTEPEKIETLVRTFLLRADMQSGSIGMSSQSTALQLLQSSRGSSNGVLSVLG